MHWEFIRAVLASVADTAIVPAQDLLGLGSEARMNRPGTIGGNWRWRLLPGQLSDDIAAKTGGDGRNLRPCLTNDQFLTVTYATLRAAIGKTRQRMYATKVASAEEHER